MPGRTPVEDARGIVLVFYLVITSEAGNLTRVAGPAGDNQGCGSGWRWPGSGYEPRLKAGADSKIPNPEDIFWNVEKIDFRDILNVGNPTKTDPINPRLNPDPDSTYYRLNLVPHFSSSTGFGNPVFDYEIRYYLFIIYILSVQEVLTLFYFVSHYINWTYNCGTYYTFCFQHQPLKSEV